MSWGTLWYQTLPLNPSPTRRIISPKRCTVTNKPKTPSVVSLTMILPLLTRLPPFVCHPSVSFAPLNSHLLPVPSFFWPESFCLRPPFPPDFCSYQDFSG